MRKNTEFNSKDLKWIREPKNYSITENKIEIVTEPHTDLWQRTYYNFRNDNAPVLQINTDEKYFSFIVKTEFESNHRFDQCGVVTWIPGKIITRSVERLINQCFLVKPRYKYL